MDAIYLREGNRYVAMHERAYESEDVLQALLAQHPEFLADPSVGNGALLLVRREASVRAAVDGGSRWRLDHLYVDARGVPTLVEVKRSSDTRGRREVVAQMLDYAANAKASFDVEVMAANVEDNAQERGVTVAALLADTLGVEDPELFWQTVAANLDAERFRLVFVSDSIPAELRRIIEFLNSQMTRTEVLAIEVKQYTDARGRHHTVVPRVIGDTSAARTVKAARGPSQRISRDELLSALRSHSDMAEEAGEALLLWAERNPRLELGWSSLGDIGLPGDTHPLLRIWPDAMLELRLDTLRSDYGWEPARIEGFVSRVSQIEGFTFGRGRRWPRVPLTPLAAPPVLGRFVAIIDELVTELTR